MASAPSGLKLRETTSPPALRTVPELRFDLTEAANRLAGVVVTERRPLPIEAANGALSGTVLIENLNGTYDGADLAVSLLRFWPRAQA